MKPLKLFLLLKLNAFIWGTSAAATDPLMDWPTQFIEFAKEVRQSSDLAHSINTSRNIREYHRFHPNPQFQNFAEIIKRLSWKNAFPEIQLVYIHNYCHVKFEPGFTCGKISERRALEDGYLYVSDPIINGEEPFLLVILSSTSPKRTSIYRLFRTHMNIAYDLFDGPRCGLDKYHGLWATYGLALDAENRILITQAERMNWDILPHESYQLNITHNTCNLEFNESFTVKLEK